jgi:hypothetical protein
MLKHVFVDENLVNEDLSTDIRKTGETSQPGYRITCYPNPVVTTSRITYFGAENTAVNISIS